VLELALKNKTEILHYIQQYSYSESSQSLKEKKK